MPLQTVLPVGSVFQGTWRNRWNSVLTLWHWECTLWTRFVQKFRNWGICGIVEFSIISALYAGFVYKGFLWHLKTYLLHILLPLWKMYVQICLCFFQRLWISTVAVYVEDRLEKYDSNKRCIQSSVHDTSMHQQGNETSAVKNNPAAPPTDQWILLFTNKVLLAFNPCTLLFCFHWKYMRNSWMMRWKSMVRWVLRIKKKKNPSTF